MAAKNNLPTPKSRSKQDPSNKTPLPPVRMTIASDSNEAVCTIDAFGSLRGIPQALLTGGAHAQPLLPTSATMAGLGVITLHYAEHVVDGDIMTWPERDEAIRNRVGGYVEPVSFTVGGSLATNPVLLDITVDSDAATATYTFDQDITAAGPGILGQSILTDPDNVQWQSANITSINAAVVVAALSYTTLATSPGQSNSVAIGTVLVGMVGGLPALEWDHFPVTWTPAVGIPFPIHAENQNMALDNIVVSWNVRVNAQGNSHDIVWDSGTKRLDNNGANNNQDFWITAAGCDNEIALSTTPNTVNLGVNNVVAQNSGLGNSAVTDFPCPTV